jgi:glutamyl-tRNA synthetase
MAERQVRVRFAPSPTGPLHIGGVRTALFNFLFARQHGGKFILRIEDTDQARFVPGAEEYINRSLAWLGLVVDEGVAEGGPFGPYKQSERKPLYRRYADQLLESEWAYIAFDTPEELDRLRAECEAEKKTFAYDMHTRLGLNNSLTIPAEETQKRIESGMPYVIRFKMPENVEVKTNDLIRGEVTFNTNTLDDKVIFKSSDGLPTYHLANIVDDHLMEISHVIRGEEWLPSVPLHVMLYRALGWEPTMPQFAHLPLILKPSGKGKLSKRDGDKDGFPVFPLEWVSPEGEISSGYRESGYFSDALVNFLALLGWNPGIEQEVFSMDELVKLFSIERVNKSGARFDPEKAKWFNHQYLIARTDDEIAAQFAQVLEQKGIIATMEKLRRIIPLVKERVNFVHEIWGQSEFFFNAPMGYDEKVVQKRWNNGVPQFMAEMAEWMQTQPDWNADVLKHNASELIAAKGQNFGNIMNALRLVLVGGSFGPDLFTIVELLGKDETVTRINLAVEKLGK